MPAVVPVLDRVLFHPMAQSFFVPDTPGVFLTKVDLWFQSKGDLPISIEIRKASAKGNPSKNAILPNSLVQLAASEVVVADGTTAATRPTDGSGSFASNATTFQFEEPVFLHGPDFYALIIRTNSGKDYNIWSSFEGDFVLGSASVRVGTTIEPGILYRAGNGIEYVPERNADLMFKLHRAKFTATSGTAVFHSNTPSKHLLDNNPFTTTSGESGVIVKHPNHGFQVNDRVCISGVTAAVNGIAAANINGTRLITRVDPYGYKFAAGSSDTASSTGRGGGSTVYTTKQLQFDAINLQVDTLNPLEKSQYRFDVDTTSGQSYASLTEVQYEKFTDQLLPNKSKYNFNVPNVILSDSNEAGAWGNNGTESMEVRVRMNNTTTDDRISPLIDIQRAHAILYSNIIDYNDASDSDEGNILLNYVAETDKGEGSSIAKHVAKEVRLERVSNGLKIFFGAHVPLEGKIDTYYRTVAPGSDVDIRSLPWIATSYDAEPPKDQNPNKLRNYEVTLGGEFANTLDEFDRYQVKLVLNSKSSSKVPRVRDLRTIAVAVES